jgi:Family of unknown function (DUF6460)
MKQQHCPIVAAAHVMADSGGADADVGNLIARSVTALSHEGTMANNVIMQFFGGSPLMVLVRLVLLSILVGVVLSALGIDAWNIIPSIKQFVLGIWDMGFDAVRWIWRYFLLGAIAVVPIWLIVRLVRAPRGR